MGRFVKFSLISAALILTFVGFAGAEEVVFYHTDQVGTPLAMSDAEGQKVWEADYKPFGEEFAVDASRENDKRFIGKEKDEETGLNYFGARYLSAGTGRFLAPDLVRAVSTKNGKANPDILNNPQSLNVYVYSFNNSSRFFDPDGLTVRITSADGSITTLNGGNDELRQTLLGYNNKSISSVEIVGHGNRYGIDTGKGDYIYYDETSGVVYGDDFSSFSISIREKFTDGASISLKGCQTARENWPLANDNDHITRKLSQELNGVEVTGYRGFGFSNELSNPFNREQAIRLGKDMHAVGIPRTYFNGDVK